MKKFIFRQRLSILDKEENEFNILLFPYRCVDNIYGRHVKRYAKVREIGEKFAMQSLRTDTALAERFFSAFELGLEQDESLSLSGQGRLYRRQDEPQRDKTLIGYDSVQFAGEVCAGEIARVCVVHDGDALIRGNLGG